MLRGPALAVALAVAYVAGSHWLMTHATSSAWAAVVILAPSLLAIAAYGWRLRSKTMVVACAVALTAIAGYAMRGDGGQRLATGDVSLATAPLLYLTQHVVIHVALALVFAVTLRRGATPLISALAARVHRHLTPTLALYTRRVTEAWVVYFVTMATLSLLLFVFAPFDAWAVFANLLTPLAVGAMFVGEYLLRYRLHPEFERASMREAIAAYRAHVDEQKREQAARERIGSDPARDEPAPPEPTPVDAVLAGPSLPERRP